MFNKIGAAFRRGYQAVKSVVKKTAAALVVGGGMAFATSAAHAATEDATSITTALTGISTSASTLFSAMVPIAVGAVALAILIKYIRKGAK